MANPYIGEIRIFGGNFAPLGWMFCEGQLVQISDYDTLFNLIGTTYGGDGQQTFALPDLRGRLPVHQGTGAGLSPAHLGQTGGVESVTLSVNQIPVHTHPFVATLNTGNQSNPSGSVTSQSPNIKPYIQDVPDANLAANALLVSGGSQPHENRMPFQCVSFIISMFGIYPSQT